MVTEVSRRDILGVLAGAACLVSSSAKESSVPSAHGTYKGVLCLFSKPLPEMACQPLAQAAKRVGFGGIDLTVRPGGHVRPERAVGDFPRAVAAIRYAGLEVPMITTALTSVGDPTARPILSTAAGLSIPFFKPGYYQYRMVDVRRELEEAGAQFRGLVELGKECGIQAGYHNHQEYIGAPVWDMASVIDPLDPKWVGFYFDPRHAVVEGGAGGWKIATNLVMSRLKMVAVKDSVGRIRKRDGWIGTVRWVKAWWTGSTSSRCWQPAAFKALSRYTWSTKWPGTARQRGKRILSLL